jgi:hypothetical protein
MPTAAVKKPVKSLPKNTKPKKKKENKEGLIPEYLVFFKPNPSPKWVKDDDPYSLDQPWPYEFSLTETSDGAIGLDRA